MRVSALISLTLAGSLLLAFVWADSTAADDDSFVSSVNVPVMKHAKRSTGVSIVTDSKISLPENAPSEIQDLAIKGQSMFGRLALRFYNPKDNLIPGAGTDDSLPNCTRGNVRQDEIVNDSQDLDLVDLLFYSYEDKNQMARARSWERPTAPYLPGDLYNPYSTKDPQQLFARWIDLVCLPTRVRRVYNKEGVAFLEYREGDRAWDKQ
jgi:hypothetical protein